MRKDEDEDADEDEDGLIASRTKEAVGVYLFFVLGQRAHFFVFVFCFLFAGAFFFAPATLRTAVRYCLKAPLSSDWFLLAEFFFLDMSDNDLNEAGTEPRPLSSEDCEEQHELQPCDDGDSAATDTDKPTDAESFSSTGSGAMPTESLEAAATTTVGTIPELEARVRDIEIEIKHVTRSGNLSMLQLLSQQMSVLSKALRALRSQGTTQQGETLVEPAKMMKCRVQVPKTCGPGSRMQAVFGSMLLICL